MASISLPPPKTTFLKTFLRHQFWPNPKPSLQSISVKDKTAIVTGSNTGIGLECGKVLLSLELSHLILAVRSSKKGIHAAVSLRKLYPEARIEVWTLDMNSYDSVRAFAQRCNTLARLDLVILNAGIMNNEFTTSPSTGHEETFQVNYLSTALLALLLLPTLKAKSPPRTPGRLTIVASVAAVTTPFPERDAVPLIPAFDCSQGFSSTVAKQRYDTTKLLLLMFALKLSARVKSEDVIVNTVDPGLTLGTELFRNIPLFIKVSLWPFIKISATLPNKGAWTYVDAAVARGDESHGSFLSDWQIHSFHPMMYCKEGERIMDRLWDETMAEWNFPELNECL
ncbi:hypothetical protein BX600DRAFT_414984 [Xylariales sp. PMI_506]|nr:hypothetical protein BX600DRAFT_414984 [Xylariales sp. PMI_506]